MSSSYIESGHKWISQQKPLESGVNYCLFFEDNSKSTNNYVCYYSLNCWREDKRTPEALAFVLSNPDGKHQEIFDAFFDTETSPWKLVLPQIEIYRNKQGHIKGVVCDNSNISAQGLINLLIACRSLQEFKYLDLLNTFRLQGLNIYEAFYLCNCFLPRTDQDKLQLNSYDSGHGVFYIVYAQQKTNVQTYLSGTPILREHGFGPNKSFSPCNTMWANPQNKACKFIEFFRKEHPTPTPSNRFGTIKPHTVTAQEAADTYLKWKGTL